MTSNRSSADTAIERSVIFVTRDLSQSGAPVAMLNACMAAERMGLRVLVWAENDGPMRSEFLRAGFRVKVIGRTLAPRLAYEAAMAERAELVVCNTVLTYEYVRQIEGRLPTVWWIREAANLPEFFAKEPGAADVFRDSRVICCVSAYAHSRIREYCNHEIDVIGDCVEDRAHGVQQRREVQEEFTFGVLGTISHRKGMDVLVEAFWRLPPAYQARCRIRVAGGLQGKNYRYLMDFFANVRRSRGRIEYAGLIRDLNDRDRFVQSLDVLVVPSRDESCSLAALEGAMMSKPLIVSSNVGAKDLVLGNSGFVFESEDSVQLAAAMERTMDMSSRGLADLGTSARAEYERRASFERHASDVCNLFEKRLSLPLPAGHGPLGSGHSQRSIRERGGHASWASVASFVLLRMLAVGRRIFERYPSLAVLVLGTEIGPPWMLRRLTTLLGLGAGTARE